MTATKDIFTLADAAKRVGPRLFSTLVKPGGSACNLNCRYCYYLDKSLLYGGSEPQMSPELLEIYVRDYIAACEAGTVEFCWHGGEPLMLGLDYFKRAVKLQHKYAGGKAIHNSIQTNGILLNEAWCRFFAENGFLVGISIDGPRGVHDANRLNRGGKPVFDRVMDAIAMMRRMHVEFNTMTVVTTSSEGRGEEIYRFLRDVAGSRFMQFLPAVDWMPDGSAAPWSVSSEAYGKFLCDIFDIWVRRDVGRCFVQLFDVTLSQLCGLPSGLCTMGETCGEGLCVEHNGDVYPCDHFVAPEYLLGNIRDHSLTELFDSAARMNFALFKRNGLPGECMRCEFFNLCHGGCPGHRIPSSTDSTSARHQPSGQPDSCLAGSTVQDSPRPVIAASAVGRNALCAGLQSFFRHALPSFERMKELLAANRAPAEIMYE